MKIQKYFLNTFPLKYRRMLRCSSFRKYYLPPATDDAVTATASALDLQIDFSFAPTKTAETEIRKHLEVKYTKNY
jgi:hypothetical protein